MNQLASHAGVSVRTLPYYYRIGPLRPSRYELHGYRHYDEDWVLMLQQILFCR